MRPTTSGTGHRILRLSPSPSNSTKPLGVATGGTKSLILLAFSQSFDTTSWLMSSESLPSAATMKASPWGERRGWSKEAAAADREWMAAREVKARAK